MALPGATLSVAYGVAVPVSRSGVERAVLVRRTYGLVFLGILVTMAGAAFTMSQPALFDQSRRHPLIAVLVFFGTLFLAQRAHRAFPANIVLTLLATFVAGVLMAPALQLYDRMQPGVVSQAAGLTFLTFGALSLYATFSRRDFSAWGGFFTVGLIVLVVTAVMNWFFKNQTASLWIAGGTVFVFGGLLVFDTWRIVRTNEYGPDDYVPAAVSIYVDLLNIFLAILRLLTRRRS